MNTDPGEIWRIWCKQKYRFRAKRQTLARLEGLLPENQGHNMALTVVCMPYPLDSVPGGATPKDAEPVHAEVIRGHIYSK